MPTRRRRTRPRRYIPSPTAKQRDEIERVLRQRIAKWNALGWAFVGEASRLRIAVLVDKKLANPPQRASTFPLPRSMGGGELKVAVMALHREKGDGYTAGGATLPPGAGIDYLAPGAQLGCDNEVVGLGAVLSIDGDVHIVTCGHAISSAKPTLTTADRSTVIAELIEDYYGSNNRLDAAVFAATDEGIELLEEGKLAPTWCDGIHVPVPDDHGEEATFWPTWGAGKSSFVENVTTFSACVPNGVGCGYVALQRCTFDGDSGSSLQLAGRYYALASQRDGNLSFFTPIDAVKRRLGANGATVRTWRPA
jgi:hypothetical protein